MLPIPTPLKAPLTPPLALRIMYCLITVLPGAKAAPTVPARLALPVTMAKVELVELSVTRYCAPDWNARLPETVANVPRPLPGRKMPPVAIVVLPTVPAPVSAPPRFTVVRLDDAIEPSTSRKPPNTVVVPV